MHNYNSRPSAVVPTDWYGLLITVGIFQIRQNQIRQNPICRIPIRTNPIRRILKK